MAMDDKISIHQLTQKPTLAWNQLKSSQTVKHIKQLKLDKPVSSSSVRFVCISDTHSKHEAMKDAIPPGDVLIHCGDFTNSGQKCEVENFNRFLGSLPHRYKIVIAGNHELTFETLLLPRGGQESVKCLLNNCRYLEDTGTEVYGIQIYGTPWQPRYGGWAFNLERGKSCLDKWNLIPKETDVLVSHCPPLGRGDLCISGDRAGCPELLATVQKRVKPKYHVFGHIHEGYGVTSDGTTVFINASICDVHYKPVNPPIIFDIPLPNGITKG